MNWHREIMPAEQADLLRTLGPVADRYGYYLAGGTAVGLYLGHRQSIDFDWFSPDPATRPPEVREALHQAGIALDVKSAGEKLVDGFIGAIRVTFILYPYPLLEPPIRWDEFGCPIASLRDLVCMKLWAVANRGSRKDFIDIYALLSSGVLLTEALQHYRRKFGVQDVMPVLYGLTYFDDAEKQPMPNVLIQEGWGRMKSAIQGWTRGALT